jgi:uncharacterized protein
MSNGPKPPRSRADLMTAVMARSLKLGPRRNKITVDRGVQVPMRDGTILLADHYAPLTAQPRPTVLMRCPYGRGWQMAMMALPLAERGYHVLLQSCRGTFGSGGQFRPGVDESADGHDTVAWLRRQDWFSGRLATAGPSYLAFVQWALALDPPPELAAMAVYVSPHDLATAGFGQGPFELFNLLSWTELMAHQERHGSAMMMWRTLTADKRLAPAMSRLPLAATGATIGGDAMPWYGEWLVHADRADPYWDGYSAAAALDRVTVPTLLVSGFHDFFVGQTMQQYHALRSREVPVSLTIGPWTHMNVDMSVAMQETLAWFDRYAGGKAAACPPRRRPVKVWTSGVRQWRDLPDWPPAAAVAQEFYLQPGGALAGHRPTATGQTVAATGLRYDPADPTPSVGGRLMSLRAGGSQDNTAVEARADVLTFSTPPLATAVEVAGVPVVRLHLSSDNPYHDLFVRLCDVDADGKSHNLTDQIVRSDPGQVAAGVVRAAEIPLTDVSHVFLPGHRIRLQLSGGAHPRFARNLGTAPDLVHGTQTVPVTHHIQHSDLHPSVLILPVVEASGLRGPADAAAASQVGDAPSAVASAGPI